MVDASVVLPYRDAAATIEEALRSVLDEREVAIEVIAIDDGSRDQGPEIVARIAAEDPRVRPLRAEGSGLVAALETGRRASTAPFLARMDADDVSVAPRIARQVERLRADASLGVVGAQVEAFPIAAVAEGLRRYVAWQNAVLDPSAHGRAIWIEAPLCHPAVTIRRSALDAVGGYRDVAWAEDYDLWLRLHAAGWGLCKLPEVLLRWRHRPGRETFTHPRYAPERFREAKALYLAPRLRVETRRIVIWGAGPTGRRFARALEPHGIRAAAFADIDPRKIGRQARAAAIIPPDALDRTEDLVLIAVGTRGARDLVRTHLEAAGWIEDRDYISVA